MILASILLDCLTNAREQQIREEQAGSRPGRGCVDQTFTLSRVLECCFAYNQTSIVFFLDFDSVDRQALFKMVAKKRHTSVRQYISSAIFEHVRSDRCLRDPGHFTDDWLESLSSVSDPSSYYKIANLSKIHAAMIAFLGHVSDDRITVNIESYLGLIAERNDVEASFRLLQLVLGCAVNCADKETYIQAIIRMEPDVQRILMQAIQELIQPHLNNNNDGDNLSIASNQIPSPFSPTKPTAMFIDFDETSLTQTDLVKRCHDLTTFNTQLTHRCQDLEHQLSTLRDADQSTVKPPKSPDRTPSTTLTGQFNQLTMSPTAANVRLGQLQDQLTIVRDELFRIELVRDELQVKLDESLKDNQALKAKIDLLAIRASQANQLKDELDATREELTATGESNDRLRKAASEAGELRVRCQHLEADNQLCLTRLGELEQVNRLRRSHPTSITSGSIGSDDDRRDESAGGDDLVDQLRAQLVACATEKESTATELSALRSRFDQLQRSINEGSSVLQSSPCVVPLSEELCSQFDQSSLIDQESHRPKSPPTIAKSDTIVQTEKRPVTSFEHDPSQPGVGPDGDSPRSNSNLLEVEQRYRGYLWKAREVIRLLERKQRQHDAVCRLGNGASCQDNDQLDDDEVDRLRRLLVDKEKIIERLEARYDEVCRHRDIEDRMMTTAWYNISGKLTRQSIERKSTSNHPDQSFLANQRRLHLTAPVGSTSIVKEPSG